MEIVVVVVLDLTRIIIKSVVTGQVWSGGIPQGKQTQTKPKRGRLSLGQPGIFGGNG